MKISWSNQGNLMQITFDAAPGETHLLNATVTEHPVEKGSAISDHVRTGPFRVSLDVVISNTPIALPSPSEDSFTEGVTGSPKQVTLSLPPALRLTRLAQGPNDPATSDTFEVSAKATLWTWSGSFDRVRKIYDALTSLMQDPPEAGITIDTTLAMYDEMQIVNLSAPRSAQMGPNAIRFTLDCQQIRTVESQQVAPVAPLKQPVKKGVKSKKKVDPEGKLQSAAARAYDSAAGR